MTYQMTEDRLVQQTVADYLQDNLGWESVFAYNQEQLGPNGTLGRHSEKEVILTRYLRLALEKLNPNLPPGAYSSAIRQISETSATKSTAQVNREKYALYKHGIVVDVRQPSGKVKPTRLKLFDFENPANNHFLAVRELWIQGHPYRRRPDILGFVNGIPLLFIELKNVHRNIRAAYDGNLRDYKDTIPHLFDHNALVVLSNGDAAKIGSITSKYEHFHEWKRLSEDQPGVVDMETMLKGVCTKANFLDLFENFILFDESTGELVKIIARNHQYLGVNQAIVAVRRRHELMGQLGVFWHTQGSGKSYSMIFFTEKVRRKLEGNFSFLIVTDREDLDNQIYKTYAGVGVVGQHTQCRASSGPHLKELLRTDLPYFFTMIHKFNQPVSADNLYSTRDDLIIISDEAHRTQYGRLALTMRTGLPNACYIGFTGTPLFKDDEITKRIFGDYVSIYDFQRAVADNATVPLYYDNRGEKLRLATTDINEKIAQKLEETDLDPDQEALLERELSREYHIITAERRLDAIARDFVTHYTTQWETGKAMVVCIDKVTVVRLYNLIMRSWQERIKAVERAIRKTVDEQEEIYLRRQLTWLQETIIAPVFSEEQGEVERFRAWGLDVVPHRTRMKQGFETPDGKRIEIDTAFKKPEHPFRVAIVCAMWLTGFDVPSLSTVYLDKPLKAHTLMQAIARANRVYEGKNNGLIVDYCGILKNLRQALATFATGGSGSGQVIVTDPVQPEEELIAELAEAIDLTKTYLRELGFELRDIVTATGFAKNAAISRAKEAVNQNEETRKRFEILARVVFRKFKACITLEEQIERFRAEEAAIDIVYKKLQEDRDQADISGILQKLHGVIEKAIVLSAEPSEDKDKIYDISKIDFARLQEEFKKYPEKNTHTYSLKEAVERWLQHMIAENPTRVDFYKRYQEIIADYNREKDRITIEETFAALLKFIAELDDEEKRAVREGLEDQEYLAIFDILVAGKTLSAQERERIKAVAKELLDALKREVERISNWWVKESTQAQVKTLIYNFLYDEARGLPAPIYSANDVEDKTEFVFYHIFNSYAGAWRQPLAA
jgi:type I restriction enzyme R subunit